MWKNLLNQSSKYADRYEVTDVDNFTSYMEKQLNKVEPELDRAELKEVFLNIYSNPVVTKELLEKGELS